MMDKKQVNRRLVGGRRVSAKCKVLLTSVDPFDHFNRSVKSGSIVFNVRGGCLYFSEHIFEQNINRIFPNGSTAIFKKLAITCSDNSELIIENIKVRYIRYKNEANRSGVVFRFVDFTEEQLDSLELLQNLLPEYVSQQVDEVPPNYADFNQQKPKSSLLSFLKI